MTDQELLALSRCPLFRPLKVSEIKKLFSGIACSIMRYQGNMRVITRGDEYKNLLIVLKGELEAEISDPGGRTIKMETLRSSSIVASGILFATDPSLPVTLTSAAGKETVILAIPRGGVTELFLASRTVLINYLRDSGDKINFLAEKIRLFKFSNLRQKTAGYLLDLAQRQGSDTVALPYTKEVMAEIFGVTRPSLSRVFSELSQKGLVKQKGRNLIILDRPALQEILKDTELE